MVANMATGRAVVFLALAATLGCSFALDAHTFKPGDKVVTDGMRYPHTDMNPVVPGASSVDDVPSHQTSLWARFTSKINAHSLAGLYGCRFPCSSTRSGRTSTRMRRTTITPCPYADRRRFVHTCRSPLLQFHCPKRTKYSTDRSNECTHPLKENFPIYYRPLFPHLWRSAQIVHRSLTLGEVLDGDRMAEALYDIKFQGSPESSQVAIPFPRKSQVHSRLSSCVTHFLRV